MWQSTFTKKFQKLNESLRDLESAFDLIDERSICEQETNFFQKITEFRNEIAGKFLMTTFNQTLPSFFFLFSFSCFFLTYLSDFDFFCKIFTFNWIKLISKNSTKAAAETSILRKREKSIRFLERFERLDVDDKKENLKSKTKNVRLTQEIQFDKTHKLIGGRFIVLKLLSNFIHPLSTSQQFVPRIYLS